MAKYGALQRGKRLLPSCRPRKAPHSTNTCGDMQIHVLHRTMPIPVFTVAGGTVSAAGAWHVGMRGYRMKPGMLDAFAALEQGRSINPAPVQGVIPRLLRHTSRSTRGCCRHLL